MRPGSTARAATRACGCSSPATSTCAMAGRGPVRSAASISARRRRRRTSRTGSAASSAARRRSPGARAIPTRTTSSPRPWSRRWRRRSASRSISRTGRPRAVPAPRALGRGQRGGHPGRLDRRAPSARRRDWDLPLSSAFELDVAPLFEASPLGAETYEDVTTYPAVLQDIAVVVGAETSAADVRGAVLDGGGELLREAEVFDRYEGEQVGEGKISLALRLEFRRRTGRSPTTRSPSCARRSPRRSRRSAVVCVSQGQRSRRRRLRLRRRPCRPARLPSPEPRARQGHRAQRCRHAAQRALPGLRRPACPRRARPRRARGIRRRDRRLPPRRLGAGRRRAARPRRPRRRPLRRLPAP